MSQYRSTTTLKSIQTLEDVLYNSRLMMTTLRNIERSVEDETLSAADKVGLIKVHLDSHQLAVKFMDALVEEE